MSAESDRWSRWLLSRRDAGSEAQREATLSQLREIRDRVLDGAAPLAGATLLDVGTGDGLIGLAALQRVGADGRVIFSDVSPALLARCEGQAGALGLLDRAQFVQASAPELAAIAAASVDVVTTRSVLIYVADKRQAFDAFARVLRPGGRISLFEPINRLMFPEPDDRFFGYEIGRVADLAAAVKAHFDGSDDEQAAMTGFDDRDLADLAASAGFTPVHVECHIDIQPGSVSPAISFDALLDSAPNPNAPTVREALTDALTDSEQARFLAELRSAFDDSRSAHRFAGAYVQARLG